MNSIKKIKTAGYILLALICIVIFIAFFVKSGADSYIEWLVLISIIVGFCSAFEKTGFIKYKTNVDFENSPIEKMSEYEN